jgi:hypothetical protein
MQILKTIKWDRFGRKSGGGTIQILGNGVAYYIGDKPPKDFFGKYPNLAPHPTLNEHHDANNQLINSIVNSAIVSRFK